MRRGKLCFGFVAICVFAAAAVAEEGGRSAGSALKAELQNMIAKQGVRRPNHKEIYVAIGMEIDRICKTTGNPLYCPTTTDTNARAAAIYRLLVDKLNQCDVLEDECSNGLNTTARDNVLFGSFYKAQKCEAQGSLERQAVTTKAEKTVRSVKPVLERATSLEESGAGGARDGAKQ